VFEGFLSPKPGRRRTRLVELLERNECFILYESVHRIMALLSELAALEPDRPLLVGREMTKEFEEYAWGAASSVAREFEEKTVKGEFTVLVAERKKS
jgi:16S rRNA (cytidine1402-2'-O)-methyltransferase